MGMTVVTSNLQILGDNDDAKEIVKVDGMCFRYEGCINDMS
jgi:hypothetical protein